MSIFTGFRVEEFETAGDALAGAGAFSVLIIVLVLAYVTVWRLQSTLRGSD